VEETVAAVDSEEEIPEISEKDGRKSKRGSKKKQQPDRITIKINPEDWFFRVFYF
jgi:hypothetical protein